MLALLSLVLLALGGSGAARAEEKLAWAVDVPGLGPLALYGKTPETAISNYVEGLIRRKVFPGQEAALRAWGRATRANTKAARPVTTLADGRPMSGIQLNSVNDLLNPQEKKSRRAFARALDRVDVATVFLPPADAASHIAPRLKSLQHLLLPGGDDIHPSLYGEDITYAHRNELNLVRDRYELKLARAALASKLPIDATCRGSQMLNVASGGTLVQDLHADGVTQSAHVAGDYVAVRHPVLLEPGSALAQTIGKLEIRSAPSMHHQAVGQVGRGLQAVGHSPDGVTEAIEGDGGRVRGYQFHAELTQGSAFSKAIFGNIAARAKAYRAVTSRVRPGR